MGIGGRIVGEKEVVDLEELGDRLAMIAGDAGRKILRCFDSTRCRFDGETRNGNRAPGRPGLASKTWSRITTASYLLSKCGMPVCRLPVHQTVLDALSEWRRVCCYNKPDDWVFASSRHRGRRPIWGQAILARYFSEEKRKQA